MSALAKPSHVLAPGLARSARLMRALGPDAAPIWAELGPEEAEALSAAMDRLADDPSADGDALRRFTQARRQPAAPVSGRSCRHLIRPCSPRCCAMSARRLSR